MGTTKDKKGNYLEITSISQHNLISMLSLTGVCASQVALAVKNLPASAGDTEDTGLIPGLGVATRSIFLPGESHGQRSLMAMVPRVQKVRHD